MPSTTMAKMLRTRNLTYFDDCILVSFVSLGQRDGLISHTAAPNCEDLPDLRGEVVAAPPDVQLSKQLEMLHLHNPSRATVMP